MQDTIKIDGKEIYQPDDDMSYSLETTYTNDSGRVQTGSGYFTPMFTVEQFGYTATHVPVADASQLLQLVIGRNFTLHCFSPYYGQWRDGTFYVGKGDSKIGTLEDGGEYISSLSFNMTGVNPI